MAGHADAITLSDFETVTGTPEQVRARLATTAGGPVVALALPPGMSGAAVRAVAAAVEAVVPLVDVILARRQETALQQIAEAITPSVPLSNTMLLEARMMAEAQEAILNGATWLTASEIAAMAGFSASNPSAQPSKWKRDGAIFAIRHNGTEYYPSYALDKNRGYRPFKELARVLAVFKDRKDTWKIAYWFGSVNSALGGKRPCDVFTSEPDRVVAAAEREVEGPVHG